MKTSMISALLLLTTLHAGQAQAAIFKNLQRTQVSIETSFGPCTAHMMQTAISVEAASKKTLIFQNCVDIDVLNEMSNTLTALEVDPSLRLEIDTARLFTYTQSYRNRSELPSQIPGFGVIGQSRLNEREALLRRIETLEARVQRLEKK